MRLQAFKRLRATNVEGSTHHVEAKFDTSKDQELWKLQQELKRQKVIFKLEAHHLFHKTNPKDIEREIELVLSVLHQAGHVPRVLPGVLKLDRFAIKCTHDLILQRIDSSLRIFFFL